MSPCTPPHFQIQILLRTVFKPDVWPLPLRRSLRLDETAKFFRKTANIPRNPEEIWKVHVRQLTCHRGGCFLDKLTLLVLRLHVRIDITTQITRLRCPEPPLVLHGFAAQAFAPKLAHPFQATFLEHRRRLRSKKLCSPWSDFHLECVRASCG